MSLISYVTRNYNASKRTKKCGKEYWTSNDNMIHTFQPGWRLDGFYIEKYIE